MTSKVGRWVSLKVARRLARTVPVVGVVLSVAVLGEAVRRKGLLRGVLDTGLDALPVVGALKGGLELLTGDLIADRDGARSRSLEHDHLHALRVSGL